MILVNLIPTYIQVLHTNSSENSKTCLIFKTRPALRIRERVLLYVRGPKVLHELARSSAHARDMNSVCLHVQLPVEMRVVEVHRSLLSRLHSSKVKRVC